MSEEGPLVGIVGCGKQAEKYAAALQSQEAPLAFFDTDSDAAARLATRFEGHKADSLEELVSHASLKGLVISTPVPTHDELIRFAIDSELGFLCEKPITEDAELTASLAALSHQSNSPGLAAMTYRYVPAFQDLRRLIGDEGRLTGNSDTLGELSCAVVRIGGRGDHRLWKHLRSMGGGAHNEMLVHMVDLALWLFGEVSEIEVLDWKQIRPTRTIAGETHNVDTEDWVVARVETPNGLVVLLQADFVSPSFGQYLEVQGTNGSFFGSIQAERGNTLSLKESRSGLEAGHHRVQGLTKSLPAEITADFLACLNEGRQSDISPLVDAVATQIAADQILALARSQP